MKRKAIDHNDVILALILFCLAFAAAWAIFFVERITRMGLFRTFHLKETYGWQQPAEKRGIGKEVIKPSDDHLTTINAIQNIEGNDELGGGGGVELTIKIFSPRIPKIYSPFKY